MTLVFPSKKTAESRVFGFDFAAELVDDGEALSGTPVITIAPLLADLADPAGTTLEAVGDPYIEGTSVKQRLRKGTLGQTYLVSATVTTSTGNVLEADAELAVVARNPP